MGRKTVWKHTGTGPVFSHRRDSQCHFVTMRAVYYVGLGARILPMMGPPAAACVGVLSRMYLLFLAPWFPFPSAWEKCGEWIVLSRAGIVPPLLWDRKLQRVLSSNAGATGYKWLPNT